MPTEPETTRRQLAIHRAAEALERGYRGTDFTGHVAFHFKRGRIRAAERVETFPRSAIVPSDRDNGGSESGS